jgi:hypothetical protein
MVFTIGVPDKTHRALLRTAVAATADFVAWFLILGLAFFLRDQVGDSILGLSGIHGAEL